MVVKSRGLENLITKTIEDVEYGIFLNCNNKENHKKLFVLACEYIKNINTKDVHPVIRNFMSDILSNDSIDIDEMRYEGCELSIFTLSAEEHLSVPII